jgi:hypothetical protein
MEYNCIRHKSPAKVGVLSLFVSVNTNKLLSSFFNSRLNVRQGSDRYQRVKERRRKGYETKKILLQVEDPNIQCDAGFRDGGGIASGKARHSVCGR